MYHVFLSHAAEDNELAEKIAHILRQSRLEVFATVPGDPPGLWSETVRLALEESEWFWLLLTDRALDRSVYVHHEFGYFFGYHRHRMSSTDVRLVGRKLRYIVRRGETRRPGMYQHFQNFPVDHFDDPEAIARIILNEISMIERQPRSPNPLRPRELMLGGYYEDAIQEYTRRIDLQPNFASLYVARARAKYFFGDRDGASEDINTAKQIEPYRKEVQNVEESIRSGTLTRGGARPPFQDDLDAGNAHLARGEWQLALEAFTRIQDHGVSFRLNSAMASICGSDIPTAKEALEVWEKHLLNHRDRVASCALRALLATLRDRDEASTWQELESALRLAPDFNLQRSPLRFLESGMAQTGALRDSGIRRIFEALPGNNVGNMLGGHSS